MSPSPLNPVSPYVLLAFCLPLGLALAVLAWRRPHQRQRSLRVLASLVAAGALWLAAFPPVRQLPVARAEAILLTEGYSADTLQAVLRQVGAGTPVWAYAEATSPKARPLASLLTLAEQRPPLQRLHVLGAGLPAAELAMVRSIPLRLHAGPHFVGFTSAYWPARLTLGKTLRVEGTIASPDGGTLAKPAAWVVLYAAGAGRDSVRLPTGGGPFRLHYQPKTTGLAQYELRLRRPGQRLLSEPVPLEITATTLPAVLLLTATPSFEFKFLKNHLAEVHYPVALRTSVSRSLVQTDFVNHPTQALDRLTPALLSHFAVIIADAATLATLSSAETQALQSAISAGRLGLITLADAAPLPHNAPARTDFVVQPRPTSPATLSPALIRWPDAPGAVRAPLPAQLRATAAGRPLVTGPAGMLLAARRRVGLGQVAVSVVPETFRWALQGHTPAYASFWSGLLAAAVPPPPAADSWHTGTRWPRPQQPLTLHLTGTMPTSPPTVAPLTGGPTVRLALRQDIRLPEWSTATFWPSAAGWHEVRRPHHITHRFYVYPEGAWQGPAQQEKQQAFAAHNAAISKARPTTAVSTAAEPWPAGWFFGLFLLAAGYLWLEEKL